MPAGQLEHAIVPALLAYCPIGHANHGPGRRIACRYAFGRVSSRACSKSLDRAWGCARTRLVWGVVARTAARQGGAGQAIAVVPNHAGARRLSRCGLVAVCGTRCSRVCTQRNNRTQRNVSAPDHACPSIEGLARTCALEGGACASLGVAACRPCRRRTASRPACGAGAGAAARWGSAVCRARCRARKDVQSRVRSTCLTTGSSVDERAYASRLSRSLSHPKRSSWRCRCKQSRQLCWC